MSYYIIRWANLFRGVMKKKGVFGVGELFWVASNSHVRASCLIHITTKMTKVSHRIRQWNMTCTHSTYVYILYEFKYKEHMLFVWPYWTWVVPKTLSTCYHITCFFYTRKSWKRWRYYYVFMKKNNHNLGRGDNKRVNPHSCQVILACDQVITDFWKCS